MVTGTLGSEGHVVRASLIVRVAIQSGSGLVLDRARRTFYPVWIKTEPDF